MGNRVIKTNKEGTIWKNFKEIIEENVVSTIIAGNITVTIKSITKLKKHRLSLPNKLKFQPVNWNI